MATPLEDLLVEHIAAWNAHDLDKLMTMFTDDCVFEAAGGNEAVGTTYSGKEEVAKAFADILAELPDAHFERVRDSVVEGTYAISEWLLSGSVGEGRRIEIHGCDLLTIRDGRIARKNSFTKERPPITAV